MIQLQEKYKKRPIRFLELWNIFGWQIKLYSIVYDGEFPQENNVQLAKSVAENCLQNIQTNGEVYKVGFVILHEAREANFILVDYWIAENTLCNHAYSVDFDSKEVTYLTPTGITACVWELGVIHFEREAWVQAVLANPAGPDLDQYLNLHFNSDI